MHRSKYYVKNKKIKLIECIPTFQGEGPDSGKRMLLVRFKHCNLNCSYCDTKDKMKNLMEKEYDVNELQELIDKNNLNGVIITGGEPLFNTNYDDTIYLLETINTKSFNIETNGSSLAYFTSEISNNSYLKDNILNIKCIWSPKNIGIFNYNIDIFENFNRNRNIYFKIVNDKNLLTFIFLTRLCNLNLNDRIYLMPEGKTKDEILNNMDGTIELANKYKVNISSRLHLIHNFI